MTDVHDALMQRLAAGEVVLIDGGTGTEIERRGVETVDSAWSSLGASQGAEILLGVHRDYLAAGAEVVITNTFATSRHALADAGIEEHFDELNRLGGELARKAVAERGSGAVAGGITDWAWTDNRPTLAALEAGAREQAAILADAGVDFFMLEMMTDVERTRAMHRAAAATGLPVWVGLSTRVEDGEVRMFDGGPLLADVVAGIVDLEIPVLSVMHTEVEDVDPSLDVIARHWQGPLGVYAHSGVFVQPNWIFNDVISPAEYDAAMAGWLDRGVQVIGGCCGIGPEHIDLLRARLD